MSKDTLPVLPSELEKYFKAPYGGLFGNSVMVNLVEEITADPYRNYRPKDLEKIINASAPSIRSSLSTLTLVGILEKDTGNQKHPLYRANVNSKRLMALTFLSYAILDDRDGTACMDEAIIDYCHRYGLIDRIMPLAEATLQKVEYTFVSLKYRQNEQEVSGNQKQIIDITSKGA
jgi:hypothetical protein